jgi:phosphoribosylformylglycinamidine synthase
LHDISDGGFIQCALEMAYAGNCGFKLKLKASSECNVTMIDDLFAEEPGWIFEYLPEHEGAIRAILRRFGLTSAFRIIGSTLDSNSVKISYDKKTVLAEVMSDLRAIWSETSFQHDRLQCNPECVEMEKLNTRYLPPRQYQLSFTPRPTRKAFFHFRQKPVVGILREEGTNGQWELAAAFEAAGFKPLDVHWTDLISGQAKIQDLAGISIAGGFANSDVFDAGKGIAGVTKFNLRVAEQFEKFLHRDDSFGFFPCNGCQAAALLGIVPWRGIESEDQPRFIRNTAERFQSRPVMLRILESNCIFLEGMAGSVLPIWVAHGEGRFHCPKNSIMGKILAGNLAPVRYADVQGEITEKYPFNPNGSPSGIAGLTTTNGRFLAMMPHPERCFRPADVQAQCWPRSWNQLKASPWLRLFQNAYKFAKA